MKFVGVDLHKKSLMVVVLNDKREKLMTKRLKCAEPELIDNFFGQLDDGLPVRRIILAPAPPVQV